MEVFCRKVLIHVLFLFFAQSIDCGYKLEPPRRGEAVIRRNIEPIPYL